MHRVSRALRGALSQQVGQVRFAGTEGWTKPASLEFPSVTGDAKRRTVTVLPGDGVGPEVIAAAQEAIAATGEQRASRSCCESADARAAVAVSRPLGWFLLLPNLREGPGPSRVMPGRFLAPAHRERRNSSV